MGRLDKAQVAMTYVVMSLKYFRWLVYKCFHHVIYIAFILVSYDSQQLTFHSSFEWVCMDLTVLELMLGVKMERIGFHLFKEKKKEKREKSIFQ